MGVKFNALPVHQHIAAGIQLRQIHLRQLRRRDQLHQLRLYCQVSNSRPVITRVEYDDDPDNLLDHDPYYRIAQQIGYTQFTNNRAYFYIPITVRRG